MTPEHTDDRLWFVRDHPDECTEEVTRRGLLEPCERPAVAVRLDEGGAYPVCGYHARQPMVPLRELLGGG